MDDHGRRRALWTTAALTCAAFATVLWLLLQTVAHFFGPGETRRALRFLAFPYAAMAAIAIGDRLCRRMRIRILQREEEVFVPAVAESRIERMPPMVLGLPVRFWRIECGIALAVVPILCGAAMLNPNPDLRLALWTWAGTLGAAWLVGRWVRANSRFRTEVGEQGITVDSPFPWLARRIPWEKIGSCTIVRVSALGRTSGHLCTLRDREKNALHVIDLAKVDAGDRRRFLEMLQAGQYLQPVPAELVSAHAPAGVGTELQASQEPTGRGTEPEAAPLPPARGKDVA